LVGVLNDHGRHSAPQSLHDDHIRLGLLAKFHVLRDVRLISEVPPHHRKNAVVTGVSLKVLLTLLLTHSKPYLTLTCEEQHATLGSLPTPYTRAGSRTASEIHGGEALTGVQRGEQDPCNALRYPTVNPPLRAARRGVKGQYIVI